jgi:hypothetical protein
VVSIRDKWGVRDMLGFGDHCAKMLGQQLPIRWARYTPRPWTKNVCLSLVLLMLLLFPLFLEALSMEARRRFSENALKYRIPGCLSDLVAEVARLLFIWL